MFDKGTPWQGRCEKPSKQMKHADKAKKGALALGRSGAELCSDGPRKSNSGWSLIPCFIPISVSVSVSYQLSLAGQGKNDLPLLFTPAEAQVKRTTTKKKGLGMHFIQGRDSDGKSCPKYQQGQQNIFKFSPTSNGFVSETQCVLLSLCLLPIVLGHRNSFSSQHLTWLLSESHESFRYRANAWLRHLWKRRFSSAWF